MTSQEQERGPGYRDRLEHLNAVLKAIRNVNQLVVRAHDVATLLQGACELLVETRGYHSAWIASMNPQGELALSAGAGLGRTAGMLKRSLSSGAATECALTALSHSGVQVLDDPRNQCTDCPLSGSYHGRSALVARIDHHGIVYGLLCVSMPQGFACDQEEVDLLAEVAGDLGYALHSLDNDDRRRLAEENLRWQRDFASSLVDSSPSAITVIDASGAIVRANAEAERVLGLSASDITNRTYNDPQWHIVDYDGHPFPSEQLPVARVLATGEPVTGVRHAIEWPDGRRTLLRINGTPLKSANGAVTHVVCTIEDVTEQVRVERELRESESSVRRKLDALLKPEGDIGDLNLGDIIEVETVQGLMDRFYALTGIGSAVIDVNGAVLVATGWQDVCTMFHRVHPETRKNCIESDVYLSADVEPGTFRRYKCKNMMWDMATPIVVDGARLGTMFLGQFFLEDESIDFEFFSAQAQRYGFGEEEYLAAVRSVPRWGEETLNAVMEFYSQFAGMIARTGHSVVTLARVAAERDRTLESLRESEERRRVAMEAANEGTWEWDFTTNMMVFDDVALGMLGYGPGEVNESGRWWLDQIHEEDRPVAERRFYAYLEGRSDSYGVEFRLRCKDGSYLWVSSVGRVIRRDLEGNPLLCIGIHRDISGRKQSDAALRESEERYRALFEQSMDAIFLIDADGTNIQGNAAFLELFGYSAEDLPGLTAVKDFYLSPSDRESFLECIARNGVVEDEVVFKKKDGSTFLCSRRVIPRFGAVGEVIGYQGVMRDVTEQRRVEQALRESEERHRALFEQSMDAIWVTDWEGSIQEVNGAWLSLTGYSREEILSLKAVDLYADPEDRERFLETIAAEGQVEDVVTFRRKDGSTFVCERRVSAVRDLDGRIVGMRGVTRDITEQKKVESALRESEEQYRLLAETTLDIIVLHDMEGRIEYVNSAGLKMAGLEATDIVGKRLVEFLPADMVEEMSGRMARRFAGDHDVYTYEAGFIDVQGERRVLELQSTPIVRAGDVRSMLIVAREVTERNRARQALIESEEKFRSLFEQSREAISMCTPEGRIIDANQAWLDLNGVTSDELGHLTIQDFYSDPGERESFLEGIERDGFVEDEVWQKRPDGSRFLVARSVVKRHAEDGTVLFQWLARDITDERARIEELRLRGEALDAAYDSILLMDTDGWLLYANQGAEHLLKYPRNILLTKNIRDITTPERAATAGERILAILEQRDLMFEAVRVTSDGRTIDLDVHACVIESGDRTLILSAERDITARKRAERALRESEERFRGVFETSPIGIAVVDTSDQHFVDANQSFLDLVGYSRDELLHMSVADITHPVDWQREQRAIRDRLTGKMVEYQLEKRYMRKDGETRDVIVIGELLQLAPGSPPLAVASAVDITERKAMETALRRSEETAQALINATTESAALFATDGTVLMCNTSFARALGFEDPEDLVGLYAFDLVPAEVAASRRSRFDEAVSSGATVVFEDSRGGVFLHNTLYPIQGENGHVESVAVFGLDTTRQRRLEADLRASREELRQLARRVQEAREEERTAIARELHDQVGQALTALKLDVNRLRKRLGDVEPCIALSLSVMDSLLDESAADVRRISSELRPGVLDDLGLEGAIEWHIDQLRQRSEIVFNIDLPSKRGTLDPTRSTVLYRVYQELITNVLRHADATTVLVSLSYERDKAVMVVSDNGRGIPGGHDKAASSLGLVGIRERLNPYGGELRIAGKPGQGTKARVVLPVR